MSLLIQTRSLYSNGRDLVVAGSLFDAKWLWKSYKEYVKKDTDVDLSGWRAVLHDELIHIWCDESGFPTRPDNCSAKLIARTALDWATMFPRGYLYSFGSGRI